MKTKRIYYYSDLLNDDFAGTKIKSKPTPENWQYIKNNIFYKLLEFVVYRLILTPLVFLIIHIYRRKKVVNKKVLKKVKGAYYLYGNHTCSYYDAMNPSLLTFPKKNYIICHPDAISIKGIKNIVRIGGGLPLPHSHTTINSFLKALEQIKNHRNVVTIYPEAHIWPYYQELRPFSDTSFKYPVMLNLPVFAMSSVYTRRKIFKNHAPRIITYIDGPFYPDPTLSEIENRKYLRDAVYEKMLQRINNQEKLDYYKYVYKEGIKPYYVKSKCTKNTK